MTSKNRLIDDTYDVSAIVLHINTVVCVLKAFRRHRRADARFRKETSHASQSWMATLTGYVTIPVPPSSRTSGTRSFTAFSSTTTSTAQNASSSRGLTVFAD